MSPARALASTLAGTSPCRRARKLGKRPGDDRHPRVGVDIARFVHGRPSDRGKRHPLGADEAPPLIKSTAIVRELFPQRANGQLARILYGSGRTAWLAC